MGSIHPYIVAPLSVAIWIASSSSLILMNKSLLGDWFPFPIVLTMLHMTFATVITWSLNLSGLVETKSVPLEDFKNRIIPLALLFTFSLIFNNYAYIYLSVSFIQMLKASTPITVLLLSFVIGLKKPSGNLILVVIMTSFGVALAAAGEIQFVLLGVILQCSGIVIEASRLVLIQVMLAELKLGPLDSLMYYAPPCALFLLLTSIITGELGRALMVNWHVGELAINVTLALGLNLATLWLVKVTSSLVLTMCGVLKDILLIFLSKFIFMSQYTMIQVIGYTISLISIYVYNQIQAAPQAATTQADLPPINYKTFNMCHIVFGLFVTIFFIGGLMTASEKPAPAIAVPLAEPQTQPRNQSETQPQIQPKTQPQIQPKTQPPVACRTQKTVRFSVVIYGSEAGGVEALLQLYISFMEIQRWFPFPTTYNSLINYHQISKKYRDMYGEQMRSQYQHTPARLLGQDPDIFEVVVVPEVDSCKNYRNSHMSVANSRTFKWQLAGRPTQKDPMCPYISHTDFLRNQNGLSLEPWEVIQPYISPNLIESALKSINMDKEGNFIGSLPPKENLILIDNDTPKNIVESLQKKYGSDSAIVVNGFNFTGLQKLYKNAKVVVDWCLVGAERMPLESSLFGALLVTSTCKGNITKDFPIPDRFFVEDEAALFERIDEILGCQDDSIIKEYAPLRANLLDGKVRMRNQAFEWAKRIIPRIC